MAISRLFQGGERWKNGSHRTFFDEYGFLGLPRRPFGPPRRPLGLIGRPISWTATDEKLPYESLKGKALKGLIRLLRALYDRSLRGLKQP